MESENKVLVDYKAADYRGFVFVVHEVYGLLLLRCTRKKNKPPHWQVTGGHIDEHEFLHAACMKKDRANQLLLAGKSGAARELFEETGINVQSQLKRLLPVALRAETTFDKHGAVVLPNEHKHRLFFFVKVSDHDFATDGSQLAMGSGNSDCAFQHVKLRLSIEHSGFSFQKEPKTAADMLKLHSGGKVSEALLMALKGESTMKVNAAKEPFKDIIVSSVVQVTASPTAEAAAPLKLSIESTAAGSKPVATENVNATKELTPSRRGKRDKDPNSPLPAGHELDLLPRPRSNSNQRCCGFC